MPDARSHRGAHPEDRRLFAPSARAALREAVVDLSWLLTRGYAADSALKLVGDRYQLTARQRTAVMRCACSDQAMHRRLSRRVDAAALRNRSLLIDGFNLLTTVETALAGSVLLRGRDGCLRDMASMHGSYRRVEETRPAIDRIGAVLARLGPAPCKWQLDRPVSNSGRLKTLLAEAAEAHGWAWEIELVADPDPILAATDAVVSTTDSGVLDRVERWFPLASTVVERGLDAPPDVVELSSF